MDPLLFPRPRHFERLSDPFTWGKQGTLLLPVALPGSARISRELAELIRGRTGCRMSVGDRPCSTDVHVRGMVDPSVVARPQGYRMEARGADVVVTGHDEEVVYRVKA